MTMSKRERKLAARALRARRQPLYMTGIGLALCLAAVAFLVLGVAYTHEIVQAFKGGPALYVLIKGTLFTAAFYTVRGGAGFLQRACRPLLRGRASRPS